MVSILKFSDSSKSSTIQMKEKCKPSSMFSWATMLTKDLTPWKQFAY